MEFEEKMWNSREVMFAYECPNYKVIDFDNESNKCIVFFSSNGIYYPNTVEEFRKAIIEKDSYDWESFAACPEISSYAKRLIYLRDVYKQWYVTGINTQYNSVEGVYNLLFCLTKGYDLITAGSSSGGYAAVLFGLRLNADKIYSFSGQFNIWNEVNDYFLLKKYQSIDTCSIYYNLTNMVKKNTTSPIYYFFPGRCDQDIKQFHLIKEKSTMIYDFQFDSSLHADTMLYDNYKYVLRMEDKLLQELSSLCRGKLLGKQQFLKLCCKRTVS